MFYCCFREKKERKEEEEVNDVQLGIHPVTPQSAISGFILTEEVNYVLTFMSKLIETSSQPTSKSMTCFRNINPAVAAAGMVDKVASCIEEIDRWMSSTRLKLNSEKTQFSWLGSRQQLSKVGIGHIQLGIHPVTPQSAISGFILTANLTMKVHRDLDSFTETSKRVGFVRYDLHTQKRSTHRSRTCDRAAEWSRSS